MKIGADTGKAAKFCFKYLRNLSEITSCEGKCGDKPQR